MYFMPKYNRICVAFAPVRPLYRYLCTMALVGAISYIWFIAFYSPLNNIIQDYTRASACMSAQKAQAQQADNACKRLEKIIQSLESSFLNNKLTQQKISPMAFIVNKVNQSGVALNACTMLKDINNDWYVQQQLQLDFSGTLKNILSFFTALSTWPMQLSIEQLVLAHEPQQDIYNVSSTVSLLSFS